MNIFVTGGTRGIGRAIALRFARDGANRVAVGYLRNDRRRGGDRGRAARSSARTSRSSAATSPRSACSPRSQRSGPLDVLVHNAATGVIRPALETDDKHWDWTMNANARALLQLARVAAPQMPDGSSIVAISSLGAQRVLENYVLVGTSKAALESVVRYLAVELAPPGSVSTPSRAASSRPVRSSTSRTATRCSPQAARTRSAGSSRRRTSQPRSRSLPHPTQT